MSTGTTEFKSEPPAPVKGLDLQGNRDAILAQLQRILASSWFKSSRHYPALLRYVVEQTLDGHAAQLKERALGIEVFSRDPHYDTNQDPVVRTSACEVRKRIAQYYHETGHEHELRIELHSGTYVPEFHWPETIHAPVTAAAPAPPETVVPPAVASVEAPPQHARRSIGRYAAAMAVPLVLAIGFLQLSGNRNPVEQFWGPVLASSEYILVCVGSPTTVALPPGLQPISAADGPSMMEVMRTDRIAFADALTLARLTGLLRENHKKYDIRRGAGFTLMDFRKGPVILIGGYNNTWTMRLQSQSRYTLEHTPDGKQVIWDHQTSSATPWKLDFATPYSRFNQDYAIISRFFDPRTEKIVVVVAGMGKDGTLAAGEFVTESRYLQAIASKAPRGWERKNVEVVISTEMVNGNPAPPRVLAVHTW